MVLRAEAEGEHVGEISVGINYVAVGVVGVLRDDAPSLGNVQDNVAVVIVAGDVEHAVHRHGQQALDTANTLLRAGLVHAPEVFKRSGCAVGEVNLLQDDVVAVPNESMCLERLPFPYLDGQRRRLRDREMQPLEGLADSPVAVVVGVQHTDRAVGRRPCGYRPETVLCIVGVQEPAVARHVAVGIVDEGRLRRVGSRATHRRVLVQGVRGVFVRGEVRRRPEAVADGVVGIAVEVRADRRDGEFRASVVQPLAHERN